ncbi:MAG: hypothetical protein KJN89_13410 [Gammaproteobacteria bacterium]|nr:hypothetical protein [Gammaproteobacteria bacterium]NNJ51367.1 hypothetical protein [Gammaproteobacteria bacterium]
MVEEVIIGSAVYDVPADNYEEFDQEIDPTKLGEKLVQSNTLKGTHRQYQLYGSNYLLLNFRENKRAKEKQFRINLAWLSSEPEHNRVIVWKWLYSALGAAALAALFVYLSVSEILAPVYGMIAGSITIAATLICTLIFVYLMRDEFIFKSRYGDARLFLLENKKPSQQRFDRYFISLQQAIEKAQSDISVPDRLVGELKMCRRLRDEGIIDDETYTKTRTAVFKHEQYKS